VERRSSSSRVRPARWAAVRGTDRTIQRFGVYSLYFSPESVLRSVPVVSLLLFVGEEWPTLASCDLSRERWPPRAAPEDEEPVLAKVRACRYRGQHEGRRSRQADAPRTPEMNGGWREGFVSTAGHPRRRPRKRVALQPRETALHLVVHCEVRVPRIKRRVRMPGGGQRHHLAGSRRRATYERTGVHKVCASPGLDGQVRPGARAGGVHRRRTSAPGSPR